MTYNTNYRESRLLTAAGAVLLTAYAVWQTVLFLRSPGEYVLFGTLIVSSGTAAAMCWWFALRGHVAESRAVLRVGCLSGVVVGGLAFLAGFIGPILLIPESNIAPIIGFIFTGPLGFVAGTAGGVIVAQLRRRKGKSDGRGV